MDRQQEERNRFQDAVVEDSLKHDFLAIQAATGVGKALAVMKCIEKDESGLKWLILVPETLQIINLQNDIKKHGMEHLYEKIEDIICYASLHKFEGRELNLVLNECHRLSECRTDISATIKYKKIIADSATINDEIKERLALLGKFHYFSLSLKSAIEKGIIPSPTIYTIPVNVNKTLKRNSVKLGTKTILLTDAGYLAHLDKNLAYWKTRINGELWVLNKLNSIGTLRKNFFTKCKTNTLIKLLETLKEKRIVCFTGNIVQCDEIGKEKAVHSKRSKKTNESLLNQYNSLEIKDIYFYKMGREGMNMKDVEAVVITQLSTGNDEGLEFLQTSGRSYRTISPEVYVLYCKGTKDEDFLKKALQNIDKQYVKELIL